MKKMKITGWLVVAVLCPVAMAAQTNTLTIEDCYRLARENYPLIRQHDLISKSTVYAIENAGKQYLPQLSINGQATYQSTTVNFSDVIPPVPGINFPTLSKDQYKIQAEISQQLYDGGVTKSQKENSRANEQIQQQQLEVNLYAIRDRVTQLYFGILLLDAQLEQNQLRKIDLQGATDKAQAAFNNGTAFRSNVDELKAEIGNTDMNATELQSNRQAYIKMLSLFVNQSLNDSIKLLYPATQGKNFSINRPELALYEAQKQSYNVQEKQLRTGYLPKLNAFIQGAYGRPTLNIVDNNFGTWWIGGLRLSWSIGALYTLKNNRQQYEINRQLSDINKETFLFNTNLSLWQQDKDIDKYSRLISQDEEVITLRSSVRQSAQAQLDNGVITVHEYISKLNAENQAKQSRILHRIQLLLAEYNFKNTSGN